MPFAQLVIGPPGSGKSTYCDGMQQMLNALERPTHIVNLDPANDHTSYDPAVDVRDLVSLDEVMEAEELGPNGGVLYALEELEHNIEWLEQGLSKLGDDYVIFDCPGQVELFTHHDSLRNIFFRLQKLGYRLVVLHLIDSYTLTLPTLYVSALLLSLRSMLQMDLPHLNVLTKIDNLASYPSLPLPLDFYTEARSLDHILPYLETEQQGQAPGGAPAEGGHEERAKSSKFTALNEAIIELVEDFGLVGFETLAVEDRASMLQLLRTVDRAGGYAFGGAEGVNDTVWQVAVREGGSGKMEVRDIEERWVDRREEMDGVERKMWEEEGRAEKRKRGADAAQDAAPAPGADEDMLEPGEDWRPPEGEGRGGGIKVVRKTQP